MSNLTTQATDETFDDLIKSDSKLVLVDFWADWCGPCKALAPVLDDIAEDFGDDVSIVKLDIVANETTADRLGVRGIPLLIFYKDGIEVNRSTGVLSKSRLANMIEKYL
ncbi:thioredoxin [Sphingomonas sp. PP-F2F-A104-K0414]|uniref:thioredoxin n=1 Tax=Sphingomonas sp. PP-F2F-A104-K0414 TaxID=2135661 RepID=UPI00104FCDFC|nr:thioredoxin [Sphingomonas sp. PP-F2F-A104-K0414]TCP97431.1 thioredoxin [Sphingomonas sp. PP-F2F-A104-K0414]